VFAVVVTGLTLGPASADPVMVMKAGEWVRTMAGDAAPFKSCVKVTRTLTDEALDKMMSQMPNCTSKHIRSGSKVTITSVCSIGPATLNTVSTMTMVSDDEYVMASKSHLDHPPQGMPAEMAMDMHWTRSGPCQPGDHEMPAQ
jgi:hypothetical protein